MLGIALEGGGAKGAFHMGAFKALFENGYKFNGIAGTSIGALNGAIVAQGDFERCYEMWERLSIPMLFDIDEQEYNKLLSLEWDKSTIFGLASKVRSIFGSRGLDTGKIKEVVGGILDERKLRESPVDFGLVTFSVSDRKPIQLFKDEIPEGEMLDYLMASSNLPGFAPKTIDGKVYIDGGLYDNLPVNLLASRGYKDIIAVRTYGLGLIRKPAYDDLNVVNILPSENLGHALAFEQNRIAKNLKMGYYDALRSIRGLSGRHYYITPKDELEYFNIFASLPDETVVGMARTLGVEGNSAKRVLFERIVPKLAGMLGLKEEATYETIFICLMEALAEEYDVEKYAVYAIEDFLGSIAGVLPPEIKKPAAPFITIRPDKSMQLLNISKEIFRAVT